MILFFTLSTTLFVLWIYGVVITTACRTLTDHALEELPYTEKWNYAADIGAVIIYMVAATATAIMCTLLTHWIEGVIGTIWFGYPAIQIMKGLRNEYGN